MSGSTSSESLGGGRSPALTRGYRAGRSSRTRGRRYPPDPPRTEEIIAVVNFDGSARLGGAELRRLMQAIAKVKAVTGTRRGWSARPRCAYATGQERWDLAARMLVVPSRRAAGGTGSPASGRRERGERDAGRGLLVRSRTKLPSRTPRWEESPSMRRGCAVDRETRSPVRQ